MKIKVLFLSDQDVCRSQMAMGVVNHYLGDRVSAFSAGDEDSSIHPLVLAVMSETGIDLSGQYTKQEDAFAEEHFDYVISLLGDVQEKCTVHGAVSYCGRCGAACPHLEQSSHGGQRVYLLGFPDPLKILGDEEKILAELRNLRDAIKVELLRFFEEV